MPKKFTFYAYRAVNDDNYHVENVNMANLEGAMLYLHHEVVFGGWRKFGINRIRRYRVTVKSTVDAFAQTAPGLPRGVRPQFMKFTAFDWGQIAYHPPGLPSVGCTSADIYNNFYKHAYGENVTYFSFPGRCYSRPFNGVNSKHEVFQMNHGPHAGQKTVCTQNARRHQGNFRYVNCKDNRCMAQEHGGECGTPDGSGWCTWSLYEIGSVTLSELDQGNSCFWDKKMDPVLNRERVQKLDQLFREKYPDIPGDIPAPKCGY